MTVVSLEFQILSKRCARSSPGLRRLQLRSPRRGSEPELLIPGPRNEIERLSVRRGQPHPLRQEGVGIVLSRAGFALSLALSNGFVEDSPAKEEVPSLTSVWRSEGQLPEKPPSPWPWRGALRFHPLCRPSVTVVSPPARARTVPQVVRQILHPLRVESSHLEPPSIVSGEGFEPLPAEEEFCERGL